MLSFKKSRSDDAPPAQAAVAAAPAAPAAPDDSFCRGVAVNDATSNAYDAETQKKVATQSYTQCRSIFQK